MRQSMKKLFALAAVALLLSGCVMVPGPYYGHGHGRGDDQGEDYDGGRYHCPPGQAKKGRC